MRLASFAERPDVLVVRGGEAAADVEQLHLVIAARAGLSKMLAARLSACT